MAAGMSLFCMAMLTPVPEHLPLFVAVTALAAFVESATQDVVIDAYRIEICCATLKYRVRSPPPIHWDTGWPCCCQGRLPCFLQTRFRGRKSTC